MKKEHVVENEQYLPQTRRAGRTTQSSGTSNRSCVKEAGTAGLAWEKLFFFFYIVLVEISLYLVVLPWDCFVQVTYTIKPQKEI